METLYQSILRHGPCTPLLLFCSVMYVEIIKHSRSVSVWEWVNKTNLDGSWSLGSLLLIFLLRPPASSSFPRRQWEFLLRPVDGAAVQVLGGWLGTAIRLNWDVFLQSQDLSFAVSSSCFSRCTHLCSRLQTFFCDPYFPRHSSVDLLFVFRILFQLEYLICRTSAVWNPGSATRLFI